MLTNLEAVNIMLSAIGASPVSTLDSLHPDVLSSKLLLKLARLEVLQAGCWFNIERSIVLNVNSEGNIVLPSNCIDVDPVDTTEKFVKRGSKLYKTESHTYTFTAPVTADMVLDLDFEDMPFVAQNFCVYSAALALQANFVGDERKIQNLSTRYSLARTAMRAAELVNGDYNARNAPRVRKLLSGIRKFGGGTA